MPLTPRSVLLGLQLGLLQRAAERAAQYLGLQSKYLRGSPEFERWGKTNSAGANAARFY